MFPGCNLNYQNHLAAEGIDEPEKDTSEIPADLRDMFEYAGVDPYSAPVIDTDNEEATLYRGESERILDSIENEDGSLERRDFPIFFTSSRSYAINRYAEDKMDDELSLIEVRVPFDSISYPDVEAENLEFADEYDPGELEEATMYYSHSFVGICDFGAVKVPEEWIESIESLDQK